MENEAIELTRGTDGVMTKKKEEANWFQMKICYGILVSNSVIMQMGVVPSNSCIFVSWKKT